MHRTILILALLLTAPTALATQPGIIKLPGLGSGVTILRDSDGIAHIIAQDELDAVRVQGWLHANDRLFQMDVQRREASGTLAELVGLDALGSDVELRTLGLRRAAEASAPAIARRTRLALEAYAAGVNAWVEQNSLPAEYAQLEVTTFEPWTIIDSLVIAKGAAFNLSFDLDIGATEDFLTYVEAGAQLGFDGQALFFDDMFRAAPFDPAATVPDASNRAPAQQRARTRLALDAKNLPLRPGTRALARRYLARARQVPLLERAVDPDARPKGSNEWAVAGEHTVNGRPLMANDPHLGLGTPSTFYQNHLVTKDGLDVIGSTFVGTPFVTLGQNRFVTWGATTNPTDVTDLYEEQLLIDPTSPTLLSTVHEGVREPVLVLPAEFRYNLPSDGMLDNLQVAPPGTLNGVLVPPFVLIVPRRNFGPLVDFDLAANTGISVQFSGFRATREIDAFRRFNRARNLDDFRAALRFFDFGSQNFSYADVAGNIAYFTSAEVPLREDLQAGTIDGLPPIFIRNGTGGNEWLPVENPQPGQALAYEILPPAEQPALINPAAGYYVNANNDPAGNTLGNAPFSQGRPGGGIYYLSYTYAIGTRAGRITQALRERLQGGPVSREDMKAIQADVVLLDARVLTPYILDAFAAAGAPGADPMLAALAADPGVAEAVGRLGAWDHTTPTGVAEGYDASDSDGELDPPSATEIDHSIAATVYSVWRGQVLRNTLEATLQPLGLPTPGSSFSMKALRNLLDNFDSDLGVGASGLDFFAVNGIDDPYARRDYVLLRSLADALELLAGPNFAAAFDGSADQNDYRWGRLHRIVFDAELGGDFDIPPAGGAFPPSFPDLPGIATDGGFGVVDASSHSAYADDSDDFMFGSGPVRRYVGEPRALLGFRGETSLPGGNSGNLDSPFYANLLGRWLTNETYPMRQTGFEIAQAFEEGFVFLPE